MILEQETKDKFGYSVNDLSKGSKKRILVQCDYCGDKLEKVYNKIIKQHQQIKKDACINCRYEKRKEIEIIVHGGINPSQTEQVKEKRRKTNKEKYGCDWTTQSDNFKEKSKKTCIKRYGTEYATQNKEIKAKVKKTNLDKYGVENPLQDEKIMSKVRQTNLEKYGCEYPAQNEEVKNKIKQTYLAKTTIENQDIQDKRIKTCLQRYGVKHIFENKETREKIIKTNIKKYGKAYPPFTIVSKSESEIKKWLLEQGYEFNSDYQVLDGQEIDLYNENLKLGIEYCGLFWHCEDSKSPRDKNYHYNKFINCRNNNIDLITIFSDEWENRKEQVKGFLKSKIGANTNRIYARNCKVKIIDLNNAKDFINKYHIQGLKQRPMIAFGIFYNENLLGVMSLNYHHRDSSKLALNRLVFKYDTTIIGGSSKLLKSCIKFAKDNNYEKIITWSDNRWSNGNVYYKMKFKLDKELNPDYSYVNLRGDSSIRHSKQSMKKSSIGCPKNVTEKAFLKEKGFSIIWDCGKKRFILKFN